MLKKLFLLVFLLGISLYGADSKVVPIVKNNEIKATNNQKNNAQKAENKVIAQLNYFDASRLYRGGVSGAFLDWELAIAKFTVPKGKFLRVTVFFNQEGKRYEIIQTIDDLKDKLNLSLNVNSHKGSFPHLYLSLINQKSDKRVKIAQRFGLDYANKLTLCTKKVINLQLNKEYTFASSCSRKNYPITNKKTTFTTEDQKLKFLPKVEFKIKLTLSDINHSFSQPRNLEPELMSIPLAKRIKYLSRKRELYFQDFRVGMRPLGDINIIQSYLIITSLTLEIADAIQQNVAEEKIAKLKKELKKEREQLAKLQD
ncbi:hypothetical protein AAEX28_08885 [Lentisphaerota bacterium WC36G]|nr:hypothetical protein LJT99_11735 [Lentisphaerae bacterium WC36]